MNNVLVVCMLEGFANLREDADGLFHRQWLARLEAVLERTIGGILDCQEEGAFVYASILNRENVRMLELFEDASFLDKAFAFLLGTQVNMQQLDSDDGIVREDDVLASIDAAKCAAVEFLYQAVAADDVTY